MGTEIKRHDRQGVVSSQERDALPLAAECAVLCGLKNLFRVLQWARVQGQGYRQLVGYISRYLLLPGRPDVLLLLLAARALFLLPAHRNRGRWPKRKRTVRGERPEGASLLHWQRFSGMIWRGRGRRRTYRGGGARMERDRRREGCCLN